MKGGTWVEHKAEDATNLPGNFITARIKNIKSRRRQESG